MFVLDTNHVSELTYPPSSRRHPDNVNSRPDPDHT